VRSSTRIILVRHGEVDGIEPPTFRGREDLLLTPRGVRQAELTRDYLLNLGTATALFASPLNRCQTTAEIIAGPQGLLLEAAQELNDIDYGQWQGETHQEVRQRDPQLFDAWMTAPETVRLPGGESLQKAADRAVSALRRALVRREGSTVIIVSHDSIIQLILLHVLGLPLARYGAMELAPCGVSVILHRKDSWKVRSVNETAQLARLG
jgi:broad specificity phosphatase PhoE